MGQGSLVRSWGQAREERATGVQASARMGAVAKRKHGAIGRGVLLKGCMPLMARTGGMANSRAHPVLLAAGVKGERAGRSAGFQSDVRRSG